MNGINNGTRIGTGFSSFNNGFNLYPTQSTGGINTFPRYEIVQVNGRNGAEMFQMGPNSKALLLDSTDPIVWLVQTDGAGYKSIDPYSITPYQPAPQIDINSINDRLTALEEKINAKSYSGTNKQRKSNTRNEQYDEASNATS